MEVTSTSRGRQALLFEGFRYRCYRKTEERISWVCVSDKKNKCPGRLKTTPNLTILSRSRHTCSEIGTIEREVLAKKDNCRKRARENLSVPVHTIFREEFGELKDRGDDFVGQLPRYESMKSSLCSIRRQALGAEQNPEDSRVLNIPLEVKSFNDGADDVVVVKEEPEDAMEGLLDAESGNGALASTCPSALQQSLTSADRQRWVAVEGHSESSLEEPVFLSEPAHMVVDPLAEPPVEPLPSLPEGCKNEPDVDLPEMAMRPEEPDGIHGTRVSPSVTKVRAAYVQSLQEACTPPSHKPTFPGTREKEVLGRIEAAAAAFDTAIAAPNPGFLTDICNLGVSNLINVAGIIPEWRVALLELESAKQRAEQEKKARQAAEAEVCRMAGELAAFQDLLLKEEERRGVVQTPGRDIPDAPAKQRVNNSHKTSDTPEHMTMVTSDPSESSSDSTSSDESLEMETHETQVPPRAASTPQKPDAEPAAVKSADPQLSQETTLTNMTPDKRTCPICFRSVPKLVIFRCTPCKEFWARLCRKYARGRLDTRCEKPHHPHDVTCGHCRRRHYELELTRLYPRRALPIPSITGFKCTVEGDGSLDGGDRDHQRRRHRRRRGRSYERKFHQPKTLPCCSAEFGEQGEIPSVPPVAVQMVRQVLVVQMSLLSRKTGLVSRMFHLVARPEKGLFHQLSSFAMT